MDSHIYYKSYYVYIDVSESNSFIRLTENLKVYNYMKGKSMAWLKLLISFNISFIGNKFFNCI